MGMWSELSNYIKIPQHTCGNCECNIGGKVEKMIEGEQTHQFLTRLSDEMYANVRSQILAVDPFPSLDRIFSWCNQRRITNDS